jgi:hypothetical protein
LKCGRNRACDTDSAVILLQLALCKGYEDIGRKMS